jgi:hypothetical protein
MAWFCATRENEVARKYGNTLQTMKESKASFWAGSCGNPAQEWCITQERKDSGV